MHVFSFCLSFYLSHTITHILSASHTHNKTLSHSCHILSPSLFRWTVWQNWDNKHAHGSNSCLVSVKYREKNVNSTMKQNLDFKLLIRRSIQYKFIKALVTQYFCTQYCNKDIFFNQYFISPCELKIFIIGQMSMDSTSPMPVVWKDFEMQLQYFDQKMSFYLFIAINFFLFISILRAKIYCVNWALERTFFTHWTPKSNQMDH